MIPFLSPTSSCTLIERVKYDKALLFADKYNINNALDFKGYELLGEIYYSQQMWDDAIFCYFRTLLNNKNTLQHAYRIALSSKPNIVRLPTLIHPGLPITHISIM